MLKKIFLIGAVISIFATSCNLFAQIKTDLGDFQAMKGNATNAMSVIQSLKDQIEALERKLKRELKDAEALLE